jgi:hypothetical protein
MMPERCADEFSRCETNQSFRRKAFILKENVIKDGLAEPIRNAPSQIRYCGQDVRAGDSRWNTLCHLIRSSGSLQFRPLRTPPFPGWCNYAGSY